VEHKQKLTMIGSCRSFVSPEYAARCDLPARASPGPLRRQVNGGLPGSPLREVVAELRSLNDGMFSIAESAPAISASNTPRTPEMLWRKTRERGA